MKIFFIYIVLVTLIIFFPIQTNESQEEFKPEEIIHIKESPEEIIHRLAIENELDPQVLINIARCESKFDPKIRGRVNNQDKGLWQINSYHNPSVTDKCAFDSVCSTEWAIKEIKAGRMWKWQCAKILGYVH